MLVHKRTMGVLDRYWTGRYRIDPSRKRMPEMKEYTLADIGGAGEEEWWELGRNSALGRTLRRIYPFCVPVTDGEGGLLDVRACGRPGPAGGAEREDPAGKGQRRNGTGLLEHTLKEEEYT